MFGKDRKISALHSFPNHFIITAPTFIVQWKNQELHNRALSHVTFLKPTWLLILGYCQETGLPICDNNQVYLRWTSPKPIARFQTGASRLCPGPSHLASNHLHSLIPQPSADLNTQLPARSCKERRILVASPPVQQDLGHL